MSSFRSAQGRRRWPAALCCVVVFGVALALTGCAQSAQYNPSKSVTLDSLYQQAKNNGWHSEETALSDKKVTREELNTAITNYDHCLQKAGLVFKLLGTNPVDGWRPLYSVSWPGLSSKVAGDRDQKCATSTLSLVLDGYELSNKGKDEMEPGFMADVLSCLSKTKYSPPPQPKSLKDLIPLGDKDPNSGVVIGCVYQAGDHVSSGIAIAY